MELTRASFTIEKSLLERLERMAAEGRCPNRSEFIRGLIRDRLVDEEWQHNEEALGTITLLFDHHRRQLTDRLTELQHHEHSAILASTHIHLDERLCAEMIMVRGRADRIRRLVEQLRQQKGVLHATLAMSSTGRRMRDDTPHGHPHPH